MHHVNQAFLVGLHFLLSNEIFPQLSWKMFHIFTPTEFISLTLTIILFGIVRIFIRNTNTQLTISEIPFSSPLTLCKGYIIVFKKGG